MSYTPGIIGTVCGVVLVLLGSSGFVMARQAQRLGHRSQGLRRFDLLANFGLLLFGLSVGAPGLPENLRGAGFVATIAVAVIALVIRRRANSEQEGMSGAT